MASPEQQFHPDYPVVEGLNEITPHWSIRLPERMNRRVQGDQLGLWRPGLSAWISVWGNPHGTLAIERLARWKGDISPDVLDFTQSQRGDTHALSFRVTDEDEDGNAIQVLHSLTFDEPGDVQMTVDLDDIADLAVAQAMHDGVVCTDKSRSAGPGRQPVLS